MGRFALSNSSVYYGYTVLDRLSWVTQQDVPGGNTVADRRASFAEFLDGNLDYYRRYSDVGGTQLVVTSTMSFDKVGRMKSLDRVRTGVSLPSYD